MSEGYAARYGLTLIDSKRDLGLSGFKGHHRDGAMGELLAAVQAGQIARGTYLLVEGFDRLSRETVTTQLELLLSLIRAGLVVVTLQDEMVYSRESVDRDWTKLILSLSKMAVAHEESAKKSERGKAVRAHKRANAAAVKYTTVAPGWLRYDKPTDSFVVIEPRAAVIREIFDRLIRGQGKRAIAAQFNRTGVAPFGKGQGWHASAIDKIARGRAVLGEFTCHRMDGLKRVPDGDPIPSYFPPVIDLDTWRAAQAAIQGRRIAGGGRTGVNQPNLLAKVARCAACRSPMNFINKGTGPKGGSYLVCSAAHRRHACADTSHHRYAAVEADISRWVREVELPAERTAQQIDRDNAIAALSERQAGLATRIANLIDLAEDGGADVAARLRDRRDERDRVEAELARLIADRDAAAASPTAEAARQSLAAALLNGAPRHEAAALLRRTVQAVLFEPGRYVAFVRDTAVQYEFYGDGRYVRLDLTPGAETLEGRPFGAPAEAA
jgi:DNA invertase Pin-like site-specific DNA recombinase